MPEANTMLKELKYLDPTVRFRKLDTPATKIDLSTFSDASVNIVSGRDYGQTVILTVIMEHGQGGYELFHLIDWASTKQRRIIPYCYGA